MDYTENTDDKVDYIESSYSFDDGSELYVKDLAQANNASPQTELEADYWENRYSVELDEAFRPDTQVFDVFSELEDAEEYVEDILTG